MLIKLFLAILTFVATKLTAAPTGSMIYVYGYDQPNFSGIQYTFVVPPDMCCVVPVFLQPYWSINSMELDPDITCNLFTTKDCSDKGLSSIPVTSTTGMVLPISGTAINGISCSREKEE
jgi:hypothetical protein